MKRRTPVFKKPRLINLINNFLTYDGENVNKNTKILSRYPSHKMCCSTFSHSAHDCNTQVRCLIYLDAVNYGSGPFVVLEYVFNQQLKVRCHFTAPAAQIKKDKHYSNIKCVTLIIWAITLITTYNRYWNEAIPCTKWQFRLKIKFRSHAPPTCAVDPIKI